jgi:hypothetical protein
MASQLNIPAIAEFLEKAKELALAERSETARFKKKFLRISFAPDSLEGEPKARNTGI